MIVNRLHKNENVSEVKESISKVNESDINFIRNRLKSHHFDAAAVDVVNVDKIPIFSDNNSDFNKKSEELNELVNHKTYEVHNKGKKVNNLSTQMHNATPHCIGNTSCTGNKNSKSNKIRVLSNVMSDNMKMNRGDKSCQCNVLNSFHFMKEMNVWNQIIRTIRSLSNESKISTQRLVAEGFISDANSHGYNILGKYYSPYIRQHISIIPHIMVFYMFI